MRVPDELSALVDDGIIDEVIRPLMSGKEAQIYLVLSQGQERVAKVYKQAQNRSFKHRADYTEGRKVRNSRDQRAMAKRSKHGREQDEASWRSTEVDTIYRLQSAGVPVPTPYQFVDGVLVMELVTDELGSPAPRLGDVDLHPHDATLIYQTLINRVVQMLCAGVVHGDLSEFNVLLGARGPVVIDFPQAVDPSKNQNARMLLIRDVENLHRFHQRFVPNAPKLPYAQEMWALFEQNRLTPDTRLSGRFMTANTRVNTSAVMGLIGDANRDELRRRVMQGGGVHHPRPSQHHGSQHHGSQHHASQHHASQNHVSQRGAPRDGVHPPTPPPAAVAPKARRVEIIVEKVARPGARRGKPELNVHRPAPLAGSARSGAQPHGTARPARPAEPQRTRELDGPVHGRGARQSDRGAQPGHPRQGNRSTPSRHSSQGPGRPPSARRPE
jgi:RIO kinase 1